MAENWGEVTESPEGMGYAIQLVPQDIADEENSNAEGFEIVSALAKEEPAVLEVLSTIVYLDRHGFKASDLRLKLGELKGHLSRYFDKSFQLADEFFGITE